MGTEITVFTVEKMQEIVDGAIVDAEILADDLVLHRHDGTDIDAGNVRGPKGDTGDKGDPGDPGTPGTPGADGGGSSLWPFKEVYMNYTLALEDAGTYIDAITAVDTPQIITIPPFADVPFPDGTVVKVCQYGEGVWSVSPGAGVTIQSYNGLGTSLGQYAEFQMRKRTGDEWILSGSLQ